MENSFYRLHSVLHIQRELCTGECQLLKINIELPVEQGVHQAYSGTETNYILHTVIQIHRFLNLEIIVIQIFRTQQCIPVLHNIQINGESRSTHYFDSQRITCFLT